MRCRELQTRYWLLEVYQDGQRPLFDILFATVDPTLDHLRRELRTVVESASEKKRALKDVIHDVGLTVRESQALLARSSGRPHLISDNGEITNRNFAKPQAGRVLIQSPRRQWRARPAGSGYSVLWPFSD